MSDPQEYSVTYSFGNFQANAPTTPLPGVQVDNELSNIAEAVAELVASIKDIRRSDGALKNQIVTYDSLVLGLQLTFDPTNGELVAAAVAGVQADKAQTLIYRNAAEGFANDAEAQAILAAASADSVNLSLFLPKAGNLFGLDDIAEARQNLEILSAALYDVGVLAGNVVQLDVNAKLPAIDGSQLINVDTMTIGTSFWWNGTSAPTGAVKENGALLSRASYPRLWAMANASGNIVTEASWTGGNTGAFSTGDLATTFRIPDARGEFFRGYDDGRGVDSGRVLGAHQAHMIIDHTHNVLSGSAFSGGATTVNNIPVGSSASGGVNSPNNGGTETRPRNNAKLVCIKAY